MFNALKVRWDQGQQFIPDVEAAVPKGFRGLPVLNPAACEPNCNACVAACPTAAITLPLTVDLGKCVLCGDCLPACPSGAITLSPSTHLASATREGLCLGAQHAQPKVPRHDAIARLFGRSLRLRSVSAGGCNGCELEINAMANVNFDLGRYGVEFVASPRHADALLLSGPITANMAAALSHTYAAMPMPRFLMVAGACAISGGLFAGSTAVQRDFLDRHPPDLYLPGCPPHPLTMVNGILDLLGRTAVG